MSEPNKFNLNPVILIVVIATLGLCIYIAMSVKKCKDDTKVIVDMAKNDIPSAPTTKFKMALGDGFVVGPGGDPKDLDQKECNACLSQHKDENTAYFVDNNHHGDPKYNCHYGAPFLGYGPTQGQTVATHQYPCHKPGRSLYN